MNTRHRSRQLVRHRVICHMSSAAIQRPVRAHVSSPLLACPPSSVPRDRQHATTVAQCDACPLPARTSVRYAAGVMRQRRADCSGAGPRGTNQHVCRHAPASNRESNQSQRPLLNLPPRHNHPHQIQIAAHREFQLNQTVQPALAVRGTAPAAIVPLAIRCTDTPPHPLSGV